MTLEFEHAFNLCDEAAGLLRNRQYGATRIVGHNHEDLLLDAVHHHTPATGHHLVLLAHDDYGLVAAVEATTPAVENRAYLRIVKFRAADVTFHVDPDDRWTWQATRGADTYAITAATEVAADEPLWITQINHGEPTYWYNLETALEDLLTPTAHTRTA